MSLKNQSRRDRKKKETRLRIIKAAQELYESKSLLQVSMEEISERADVSRVTLYNYFKNQECIILNIGIKNMESIIDNQRNKVEPQLDGLTQFRVLFQDLMESLLTAPLNLEIWHFFLNINAKAITPDRARAYFERIDNGLVIEDEQEYLMALYLKKMRVLEENWLESIKRGRNDDTIKSVYESDQMVHFLFTLLSGLVNTFYIEKYHLEQVNLDENIFTKMTLEVVTRFLNV